MTGVMRRMLLGNGFARPLLLIGAIAVVLGAGAGLLTATLLRPAGIVAPLVVTKLAEPRGLAPLDRGALLIAEVGGGRLLRLDPSGTVTIIREDLPSTRTSGSEGENAVGVSAALHDNGIYYYVIGEFRAKGYSELYRWEPDSVPEALTGQDLLSLSGPNPFTNPYDLALAPGGGFFVSDAGANAVFSITEAGEIVDYATFPNRTDSATYDQPSFDVVPTGITIGPDGALYLASLTGYPYPKGAAYVYRLEDLNADGDALDEGETIVFADGFSVATDLAFDEDDSLLVTEFSTDMHTLITEFGISEASRIPGRLVRWRHGGSIEVVANGLVSPTAVAVTDGRIFVSEEFAGRVSEVGAASQTPSRGIKWALSLGIGITVAVVIAAGGVGWRLL
jgi:sugar lactone lactonase YvrE